MIVLGFDPGGRRRFGCTRLDGQTREFVSFTADSVDHALIWLDETTNVPLAAGIDTLLFWQSTDSGWRGADEYLRKTYSDMSSSVMAANSMYGAMSIQGAVLAHRLRARWPNLVLTETHPKVLWYHLTRTRYPANRKWRGDTPERVEKWLASEGLRGEVNTEDEFDSLLSAWAALKVCRKEWTLDLSTLAASNQIADNVRLVEGVHYFWPS